MFPHKPTSPTANHGKERENNFNFLRLALATIVVFGHAFEMRYDIRSLEPLSRFTGTSLTWGDFGLAGFFLISGFLVVRSWQNGPRLAAFAAKRLLRIVPGYLVAAVLSTLVVGLATWHSFEFFRQLTVRYPLSLLLLDSPITPSVFPGHRWNYVNGALWSIKYEFRCYLLVALVGWFGGLRRPLPWLLLTCAVCAIGFIPSVPHHLLWHHYELLLGNPKAVYKLTPAFLLGGCFSLLWEWIPQRLWLAVVAALLLLPMLFHEGGYEPALLLLGGYLLLSFAYLPIPSLKRLQHWPDLSYGIYLYGWPVEALWTWHWHTNAWVTFAGTMAICVPLAMASWYLVERPALLLKPKGSVPVPDAA